MSKNQYRLDGMQAKNSKCASIRRLISGSILLISGCLLLIMCPWIVSYVLNKMKTLTPNGFTFSKWQKNPMPMTFDVYLFNWSNPEDINNPNIKPRFKEIGPFVFDNTREKVNVTWNANGTVSYKILNFWYFNEEKSVGNLSLEVTIPDMLALSSCYRVRDWTLLMKKGFEVSLRTLSHAIHVRRSVGELLFDGYDDPLFTLAKSIPFPKSMKIPDLDRFGFFYTRNGSADYEGAFNMDITKENFGKLKEWKYSNRMEYFDGECNKIKGSAGDFFPLNLQRDHIQLFNSDLCRALVLDYDRDVFVSGIKGYKYVLGESFLDNGTKVPENLCFVSGENIPSGAFNISASKYGTPGSASMPHFYGADPYYLRNIEGLQPIKEKHQMFMILEPTSGIPLHVEARFQLNAFIQPIKGISLYERVPKMHIPMVWFEQKAVIPTNLIFLMVLFVYMPLALKLLGAGLIIFGIGSCILAIWNSKIDALLQKEFWKRKKKSNEIKLNEAEMNLLKK